MEKMSFKTKLLRDLKEIFWVSMYFFCWFGALMLFKVLLLDEYKLEFYGASIVIVGTLIAAKAVIILRKIPLFKNQPAWVDLFVRTLLYMTGIFILLVLEKGFEARHEYDGFIEAMKNLFKTSDVYHIWIDTLCVFGALIIYNFGAIIKLHLGEDGFRKILRSPVPINKKY